MTGPLPNRPARSGRRRAADLGRLDPSCTATFHGTYTAYRRGCCCPHAREDHRIYHKRLRENRCAPGYVNVIGVVRRIQALWAIGHTSTVIAEASGSLTANYLTNLWRRQMVTVATWEAVNVAYRALSGIPGTSDRTRNRATAAGYPSPMRWGADIDDPAAVADPVNTEISTVDTADDVVVRAFLGGEPVGRALKPAEQAGVLRLGLERGRSLTSLAEQLRINNYIARDLLAGRMPTQMAKRQLVEAELLRTGGADSNYVLARRLGVNRQTVIRARDRLAGQLQLAS